MKYNNKFTIKDVQAINEAAARYRIHPPTNLHDETAMDEYCDECNSKFGKMWAEWPEVHPGLLTRCLEGGEGFIESVQAEFEFIKQHPDHADEEYTNYIKDLTISV